MRKSLPILAMVWTLVSCSPSDSSSQAVTPTAPSSPAPATKVEGFRPAAGTVMTFGYNELGRVGTISVDAREMSDTRGGTVRGVAVQITEGEYKEERSFVDADELPELIRGIDALLAVKANPTRYENFEVRYTTKGELQITAFNSGPKISFAIRAGRVTTAQAFTDEEGIRRLRAMFETANQLLNRQPK